MRLITREDLDNFIGQSMPDKECYNCSREELKELAGDRFLSYIKKHFDFTFGDENPSSQIDDEVFFGFFAEERV